MSQPITFDVQVDQNEYLAAGVSVMHAAISVTAAGALGPAPTAAQVIMIDCSGSMAGAKLAEARRATSVAIDTLRDGVAFAVVSGTAEAAMVFPSKRRMVAATAESRAQAKDAVRGLVANGGTAIGTWLELADRLLADRDEQIKHGILLTDGHNEHQTPEELHRVLERCRGRFVCDSRGVGRSWEAKPLLEIADVLLGSAEALTEPADLTSDFQKITENVMGKVAADVSLRLWTLPGVTVRFLKQIYPRIVDLTGRGCAAGGREVDFPTGQWGAETRRFHLCVEVPVGSADEPPVRVAKAGIVCGTERSEERRVRVRWTEDPARSTKINPAVAHLTGQVEIAENITAGLAAIKRGDEETATARLGRAAQLATESGNEDTLRAIDGLVEVNPTSGTVRLRKRTDGDAADVAAELAALQSKITVPYAPRDDAAPDRQRPDPDTPAITITLSDQAGVERVRAAMERFLRAIDVNTAGSITSNTDTLVANIEPVITALGSTKDAVVRAGAVLIVRENGAVAVYELTTAQRYQLDHRPRLTGSPAAVRAALRLRPEDSLWPP